MVIPPPGSGDPPGETSGYLQDALSAANSVTLDPVTSNAHAFVHFDDHLGFGHSDSSTSAISGHATLYGLQRPDGSSRLLFEVGGSAGDMKFHFSNVDVLGDVDVSVTGLKLSGGMGDTGIDFGPTGMGIIPSGALTLIVEANVNGQRTFVTGANGPSILVSMDFQAKTFSIPAFTTSLTGMDLTIALSGTITNQPPRADAGPSQTLQCASPTGASAVLQGSSSDPDVGEFVSASWAQSQAFGSTYVVSNDLSPTVIAPFTPPATTTQYFLAAEDAHSQIARSQTSVTVQDTTPPTLTLSVDPSCLWPPNHRMVLYELGSALQASATDTCDATPSVAIDNVTSDQAPTGGGSGNTGVDVLFGQHAFCVRAERDGTIKAPRTYSVSVVAKDASGNQTKKDVSVTVARDQAGLKCANVDSTRLVDDNDPRCTAN